MIGIHWHVAWGRMGLPYGAPATATDAGGPVPPGAWATGHFTEPLATGFWLTGFWLLASGFLLRVITSYQLLLLLLLPFLVFLTAPAVLVPVPVPYLLPLLFIFIAHHLLFPCPCCWPSPSPSIWICHLLVAWPDDGRRGHSPLGLLSAI
jgi:hypothetical protein